jgi:hypothetical protein
MQIRVGLGTLLAVVFITLKLVGAITWPWLWVLSPLWISFLIGLAIGLWQGIDEARYRRSRRPWSSK